ncbi:AAA family ATPase [Mucilaginibacter flavidus]|uniref:AAA family ATPase n=1 Tax=Mucilaginibacter flavidus TaxID=2949309 RepID=UPI002093DDE1|nr:AAA family ATPase [Mucilaginibacter flavidus]MCO5948310.1 AAA family ATPase [Mucilaginibacter flavidus]
MKIIAVRPHIGCNPNFLKVLKSNKLYRFYTDYEIDPQDKLTVENELAEDVFFNEKTSEQLTVNISAIVGKNGSGKSSLIELIMRAINNIAFVYMKPSHKLIFIPKVNLDLFFEVDSEFYKCQLKGKQISFYKRNKETKMIKDAVKDFDLRNFFYTIAVNYSHYAYNLGDFAGEGGWLTGVFHKNDGYQTPLVLNPFREANDIAIDNEKHLVKSRLIVNLALAMQNKNIEMKKLSDGAEVQFIRLKKRTGIDKTPIYSITEDRIDKDGKIELVDVNVTVGDIFSLQERVTFLRRLAIVYKFPYDDDPEAKYKEVYDYLIYKTVRIAIKYFREDLIFFEKGKKFDSVKLDKWISNLLKEPSHITLKLRQTINFLNQEHFKYEDRDLDLIALDKSISGINENRKKKIEVIDLIPPPIFDVEIFLKTTHGKKIIPFSSLSSGEKQLTYSTNSLLYHLLNIESVYSNTSKRTAYRNVNIFLEEVELYAHPDMQRKYVSTILSGIKNLGLKKIRGINISFLTHSPFILTDIPNSNILFLTDNGNMLEKSKCPKTFGGNIHDLLADSFFLKEGTIGSFSHEVINKVIEDINKLDKNAAKKVKDQLLSVIEIIGEPFIRMKVFDLFYSKFSKENRILELEEELKRLKND